MAFCACGTSLVAGKQRHEISKRRNRLRGGVLVVFSRCRLSRIRNAFPEQRVGGDGRLVVVTVGGSCVGLYRVRLIFLLFARGAGAQLRMRSYVAVRTVLDDFFEHLRRLIHRGIKRQVPQILNHSPPRKRLAMYCRQITSS